MIYFAKNLAVIQERVPALAEQVIKYPDTIKARKKQLICGTLNGTTVSFPDLAALKKAKTTAKNLLKTPHDIIVYSGCGAGHVVRAMAKILPENTHLIVQERFPEIFKAMITYFDCRDLLAHPRVQFAIGRDVNLCEMVQAHLLRHGHDVQVASDQEQWALFPEYRHSIDNELMPFLADYSINYNTLATFGARFTENCIRQVPAFLTSLGVDVLKGQFEGFPAIVIGGGPSLEKNVEVVRAFKGKGVIICADTVLGYLINRGIAPDFVVSVDPQDRTFEKYKDLTIPSDVALVYHPGSRYDISLHWPHDKYHTGTGMGCYAWADPFLGHRLAIDGNIHCQVHYGCNLAVHLGCRPIALVGMDLAFTDGLVHTKGGSYMEEQEEKDYVAKGIDATDILGHPVKTTPVFVNYQHILATKAKEEPDRYINATEAGLGIPGVPNFTLAYVLHSIGLGRFVLPAERRRFCHQFARHSNAAQLLEEAWRRVYDLDAATKIALKCKKIIESPIPRTPKSRRLARLTKAMRKYTNGLSLLHLVAAEDEQGYMHKVDDHVDSIADRAERYEKQIERLILYIEPIINLAPIVQGWLTEMLENTKEIEIVLRGKWQQWLKGGSS